MTRHYALRDEETIIVSKRYAPYKKNFLSTFVQHIINQYLRRLRVLDVNYPYVRHDDMCIHGAFLVKALNENFEYFLFRRWTWKEQDLQTMQIF